MRGSTLRLTRNPHSCLALARTPWRIPTLKPHSPSRHSLTQRAYPDTIHSLEFPLELRTCLIAWAYIVSLPVAWTYNNMTLVQIILLAPPGMIRRPVRVCPCASSSCSAFLPDPPTQTSPFFYYISDTHEHRNHFSNEKPIITHFLTSAAAGLSAN